MMKVAVTSTGESTDSDIEPRFGRAPMFVLFDTATGEYRMVDNAAGVEAAHGAGVRAAETLSRLGIECLITGQLGPKASRALQAAGIKVIVGEEGTVGEAVDRLKVGEISPTDALPRARVDPDRS
jgi:predicted Fe-Mo cluster-binding NifX family protein